jgi:predicted TPR repeat methyltransferase
MLSDHDRLRRERRIIDASVEFSDALAPFDELYEVDNPWSYDTPDELHRFRQTRDLIASEFGRVGTLLEVGCGEGHLSGYLAQACDHLTGIEPCESALDRARQRLPGADLRHASFSSFAAATPDRAFDVVAACEVLYYFSDPAHVVAQLSRIADAALVTYFQRYDAALAPLLDAIPGVRSTKIAFGRIWWRAVYWRNPAP